MKTIPRWLAITLSFVPLLLLVVARFLSPSPRGLGTHQQLGLPPCSLRVMLGIECPACGMTTSWSHFTRGQWIDALHANYAGVMLAAFFVAFCPFALWHLLRDRRMPTATLPTCAVAVFGMMFAMIFRWLCRIV
ncbi:MAG: DUF2752 domain-containing protein [Planctomycetota bacterium]